MNFRSLRIWVSVWIVGTIASVGVCQRDLPEGIPDAIRQKFEEARQAAQQRAQQQAAQPVPPREIAQPIPQDAPNPNDANDADGTPDDQNAGEPELDQDVPDELKKEWFDLKQECETQAKNMLALSDPQNKEIKKIANDLEAKFQENHDRLMQLKISVQPGQIPDEATDLFRSQQLAMLIWSELNVLTVGDRSGMHVHQAMRHFSSLQSKVRGFERKIGKYPKLAQECREYADSLRDQMHKLLRRHGGGGEEQPGVFAGEISSHASDYIASIERFFFEPPILPRTDLHPGRLDNVRKEVAQLVKLKWDNERLALNRQHWSAEGFDAEAIQKAAARLLEEKGITVSQPDEDDPFFHERNMGQRNSRLVTLMDRLRERCEALENGQSSSRGYSGGGDTHNVHFETAHLACKVISSPTDVTFEISDRQLPMAQMRLDLQADNVLRIVYIDRDIVFSLRQDTDGSVVYSEVSPAETIRHAAPSMTALYSQSPDLVEQRVFGLLGQVGVGLPLTRFNQQVVARVVELLERQSEDTQAKVKQLLQQLDDDDYLVRQAASDRLAQVFDIWNEAIMDAVENPDLTIEAKKQISDLADKYEVKLSEMDHLIHGMKLLDSPDYLFALTQHLPESQHSLLFDRLRQCTRQDLGNDSQAWQAWLQSQHAE
ncbi:MAG: hypothetical protein R3C28_20035 [Pirellulaceae bacterium]